MQQSVLSSRACILALLLLSLAVGGCGDDRPAWVSNAILSMTGFEAVNLVNGTERDVSGTLTITDPGGGAVLEESFQLEPDAEEDGWFQINLSVEGDPAVATHEAPFADTGRYDVTMRLDDGDAHEESVEITAPSEQRLLVVLHEDEESPIQVVRMPNPDEGSE